MNNEENIKRVFDRNELRRLQKAARDKDIRKLAEWGYQFEEQIRQEFLKAFDKEVEKELQLSVDNFIIAIVYTLHFNEKCKFGGSRIQDFMEDLLATVDCFKDGSYSPKEFKDILAKEHIELVARKEQMI